MPTIVATVGGPTSNSYLTYAEANIYFDGRLPLKPVWLVSGQENSLIMAARVLDMMAQPRKTLFTECGCQYYRISRQWTGRPAVATQKMAWPRVGMFDHNGNPLDFAVESIAVGNPAVVTTKVPHLLETGEKVLIFGATGSTPDVNGEHAITVTGSYTFTIPVDVTVAADMNVGGVTFIPLALKDAQAELAGQLRAADRTLDLQQVTQGVESIRAGSVAISFRAGIVPQVLPDGVLNLMPKSWLTDELFEPAQQALFDVVSWR